MMNDNWDAAGNYRGMIDMFGHEYILRQAAEECMELGQKLLKFIRVRNQEATPVTFREAYEGIIEEIADVQLMTEMVIADMSISNHDIGCIRNHKIERMEKRLYEEHIKRESDGFKQKSANIDP